MGGGEVGKGRRGGGDVMNDRGVFSFFFVAFSSSLAFLEEGMGGRLRRRWNGWVRGRGPSDISCVVGTWFIEYFQSTTTHWHPGAQPWMVLFYIHVFKGQS